MGQTDKAAGVSTAPTKPALEANPVSSLPSICRKPNRIAIRSSTHSVVHALLRRHTEVLRDFPLSLPCRSNRGIPIKSRLSGLARNYRQDTGWPPRGPLRGSRVFPAGRGLRSDRRRRHRHARQRRLERDPDDLTSIRKEPIDESVLATVSQRSLSR